MYPSLCLSLYVCECSPFSDIVFKSYGGLNPDAQHMANTSITDISPSPLSNILITFNLCFLCIWPFCPHVCWCTTCVSGILRGQKKALNSLKLKIQVVLKYNVDAKSWAQVFRKSSQWSWLLSYISKFKAMDNDGYFDYQLPTLLAFIVKYHEVS